MLLLYAAVAWVPPSHRSGRDEDGGETAGDRVAPCGDWRGHKGWATYRPLPHRNIRPSAWRRVFISLDKKLSGPVGITVPRARRSDTPKAIRHSALRASGGSAAAVSLVQPLRRCGPQRATNICLPTLVDVTSADWRACGVGRTGARKLSISQHAVAQAAPHAKQRCHVVWIDLSREGAWAECPAAVLVASCRKTASRDQCLPQQGARKHPARG